MTVREVLGAAKEVLAWIINPMLRPWEQTEHKGTRIVGEVAAVGSLPLLYNWLREHALNVTVVQSNLLVFLGELGLPLLVAIAVGFLPAFRRLDAYQASLVGLWVQRALSVQLILLGVWAIVLISRRVQMPEPEQVPLWLTFYFAYWLTGGIVAALAARAMRSGSDPALWREVFFSLALYFLILACLQFARIPYVGHPWFAQDI